MVLLGVALLHVLHSNDDGGRDCADADPREKLVVWVDGCACVSVCVCVGGMIIAVTNAPIPMPGSSWWVDGCG